MTEASLEKIDVVMSHLSAESRIAALWVFMSHSVCRRVSITRQETNRRDVFFLLFSGTGGPRVFTVKKPKLSFHQFRKKNRNSLNISSDLIDAFSDLHDPERQTSVKDDAWMDD